MFYRVKILTKISKLISKRNNWKLRKNKWILVQRFNDQSDRKVEDAVSYINHHHLGCTMSIWHKLVPTT